MHLIPGNLTEDHLEVATASTQRGYKRLASFINKPALQLSHFTATPAYLSYPRQLDDRISPPPPT